MGGSAPVAGWVGEQRGHPRGSRVTCAAVGKGRQEEGAVRFKVDNTNLWHQEQRLAH